MDDEFLTVMEVAEILKLNPQTVRNWIDRGELRAVRVGSRRVRVRKSDFDAFLAKGSSDDAEELDQEQLEELADAAIEATAVGTEAVSKVLVEHPGQARRIVDLALTDFVVELNRAIGENDKPFGLAGNEFMRRYDCIWNAKLAL